MKYQMARKGRFAKVNQSLPIPVSELQAGMFVSKLDCEWSDTPFLLQGFLVETQEQIDEIARYSEVVWVDRVNSEWIDPQMQATFDSVSNQQFVQPLSAEDRVNKARGVFDRSRQFTKSLMDDVRLGRAIDTQAAKETVAECVDAVISDPDAMRWMSRMREKHNYTVEHSHNVCMLTIAFGRHLGMQNKELHDLGLCALLHDVGKMGVPTEILDHPGKLNPEQWEVMAKHASIGRDLLMSSSGLPHVVVDVAYAHHEKINGDGYPRALKGAAIPRFAKIISLVDVYDALTADRCYSAAMPSTKALKIIFQESGEHFDEELAEQFIQSIGLYPPGTIVELINGEVALVLSTNHKYQHLPRVLVVLDENKQPCKERVRNLAEIDKGTLGEEYFIRDVHIDGTFGIKLADYREKGLQFAGMAA